LCGFTLPGSPESSSVTLPGQTDPSAVESNRKRFYRSVVQVGVQVAEALEYAHREGVVHRDVKPSNLLLDAEGRVWVTDFGLAKTAAAGLTQTGDVVGTVRYMAPERFRGWADPRSDVYSLGLTLYELVALRPAFHEPDRLRLIRAVTHEEPPRLRKLDPAVPRDLETVIAKAIDKEPERRYATAAELAADLRRFDEGRPILARRVGRAERTWRWARRNPAVATLLTAVFLSLAGGLVGVFLQWREAERHLYQSLVSEARALRLARQPGYRSQVWERLKQAIALDVPDKDVDELRREAAACLGDFLGRSPVTWTDFPDGVTCLALDPQGTQVAAGLMDGTAVLRRIATGEEVWLPPKARLPRPERVTDIRDVIAFDPSGTRLLLGQTREGGPSQLRAWDRDHRGGWQEADWIAAGRSMARVATTPNHDHVAVFVRDAIEVWQRGAAQPRRRVAFAKDPLTKLAVSPNGKWLAAGYERLVHVWEVATGMEVASWSLNTIVLDLRFSPDGQFLACGFNEGIVIHQVPGFGQFAYVRGTGAHAVAFRPDSRIVAFVQADKRVRLWSLVTREEVVAFAFPGTPGSVAFSGDGLTLAAANGRGTVRLWNLDDTAEKRTLVGHDRSVRSVAFSRDGTWLASVSYDRTVKLWDTASGAPLPLPVPELPGSGLSVAISPDGRLLATCVGYALQVWDRASGRLLFDKVPPPGRGLTAFRHESGLAFSPNGRHLAAACNGLLFWDIVSHAEAPGQPPAIRLKPVDRPPQGRLAGHLCFSPNGRFLAWVGDDRAIQVWDLANDRGLPSPGRALHNVQTLAFFPDSQRLVFLNDDNAAEVWDVTANRRVFTFPAPFQRDRTGTSYANQFGLSPDGRWLAVKSESWRGVGLWDAATGRRLVELPDEAGAVRWVSWSRDSRRLAVSRSNGSIVIWDIPAVRTALAGLGLDWKDTPGEEPPKP
jgi:WD40 repeat protein